jgi:hypothetical protein
MSVSLSYRSMPKSTLPFKSTISSYINNPNINLDDFKIGNTATTIEARFYLGLQKMSGFYIAPYYRMANFDLSVPVSYTFTPAPIQGVTIPPKTATAQLDGSINSSAFGAYFGVQYQIFTKVVLDLWIAGGSYGTSTGILKFNSTETLVPLAQNALQSALDQTKIDPFKLKTTVNANGATADMSGPWAGFRGLGLTVGIRF